MKAKYAGTCQKDNQHQWKIDDEIFICKGADDKWIMCTQKECFSAQGGRIDEKKQFVSAKFKLESAKAIMDMTEGMFKKFIEIRQDANKDMTTPEKYNNLTLNEQAVFIESVFRTLSQNFKP